eukprot:365835-Chlamydomonas_euryale.AAC.5
MLTLAHESTAEHREAFLHPRPAHSRFCARTLPHTSTRARACARAGRVRRVWASVVGAPLRRAGDVQPHRVDRDDSRLAQHPHHQAPLAGRLLAQVDGRRCRETRRDSTLWFAGPIHTINTARPPAIRSSGPRPQEKTEGHVKPQGGGGKDGGGGTSK